MLAIRPPLPQFVGDSNLNSIRLHKPLRPAACTQAKWPACRSNVETVQPGMPCQSVTWRTMSYSMPVSDMALNDMAYHSSPLLHSPETNNKAPPEAPPQGNGKAFSQAKGFSSSNSVPITCLNHQDPFQGNGIKEGEVNGGQSEGGARNLRGQIALGYMNDKEVDPQSPVHSSEGEGSDPMGRPGTAAKRRVIEVAQGNGGRDVVEQRHNSKEEVEVAQGNGAQGVVERQQQQRRQQQQQQQQQQQEEGSSEGSASCCRQAQMEPEGFGKGYPNLGPKPSDAYASVEPGYSENGEEGALSVMMHRCCLPRMVPVGSACD
eukprot:1153782-Pelagomonas_calceolata.AAC.9